MNALAPAFSTAARHASVVAWHEASVGVHGSDGKPPPGQLPPPLPLEPEPLLLAALEPLPLDDDALEPLPPDDDALEPLLLDDDDELPLLALAAAAELEDDVDAALALPLELLVEVDVVEAPEVVEPLEVVEPTVVVLDEAAVPPLELPALLPEQPTATSAREVAMSEREVIAPPYATRRVCTRGV